MIANYRNSALKQYCKRNGIVKCRSSDSLKLVVCMVSKWCHCVGLQILNSHHSWSLLLSLRPPQFSLEGKDYDPLKKKEKCDVSSFEGRWFIAAEVKKRKKSKYCKCCSDWNSLPSTLHPQKPIPTARLRSAASVTSPSRSSTPVTHSRTFLTAWVTNAITHLPMQLPDELFSLLLQSRL